MDIQNIFIMIIKAALPITEKSNQFHASRKYVKSFSANPLDNNLTVDSYV